jgi:hypothetical protein
MRVISFDIGVSNLAYCEMESDSSKSPIMKKWEIISLRPKNEKLEFDEMMRRLLVELRARWPDPAADHVLLENQPCLKNPVMKSIQVYIYAYFSMHGTARPQLFSASNKLKVARNDLVPPNKKLSQIAYGEKKKMAIVLARLYIAAEPEWLLFFERAKKKDDYADCYLQAVYFFENAAAAV